MILQLNPTIPVISPLGKGFAFLVLDYSQEHNLLFTVAQDNGEIWTWQNHEIRMQENISLGRSYYDRQQESEREASEGN